MAIDKKNLVKIFLVLLLALGVYTLMMEKSDDNTPKNVSTIDKKIKIKNSPSAFSNGASQINDSVSVNKDPNFQIVSQSELQAMSIDEYLSYMLSLTKLLPEDLREELYKRQAAQIEDMEKLGYFSDEQKEVYVSYDTETLEALGDQGDLVALNILAKRYHYKDKNETKAMETYFKSVLFGSANAAVSLAIISRGKAKASYDDNSAESRLYIYNSIAWYKIASMMGDKRVEEFMLSSLQVDGITLNEQEWEKVNYQAEAAFTKLNEKRIELGLSEY